MSRPDSSSQTARAEEDFRRTFSRGEVPDEIETRELQAEGGGPAAKTLVALGWSASMREAYVQMMSASIPATLPERITLHEGIMTGRFEAMKATNAATLALYNALDNAQKKKADELILGMGMM